MSLINGGTVAKELLTLDFQEDVPSVILIVHDFHWQFVFKCSHHLGFQHVERPRMFPLCRVFVMSLQQIETCLPKLVQQTVVMNRQGALESLVLTDVQGWFIATCTNLIVPRRHHMRAVIGFHGIHEFAGFVDLAVGAPSLFQHGDVRHPCALFLVCR